MTDRDAARRDLAATLCAAAHAHVRLGERDEALAALRRATEAVSGMPATPEPGARETPPAPLPGHGRAMRLRGPKDDA